MDNTGFEEQISKAKENDDILNSFVSDYLPFIRKQVASLNNLRLEYDDMLSIAIMAFVVSVKQYNQSRGGFLSFAAVNIRNRIIDENRKYLKYSSKIVPIVNDDENKDKFTAIEVIISLQEYNKELERQSLSDEIGVLSDLLQNFDISFSELPKICPKQTRSRTQCIMLAKAVVEDDIMRDNFLKNHRISRKELAYRFKVSEKTIEKHRKYIVTIALLLIGDFPCIRAFLPQYQEVR